MALAKRRDIPFGETVEAAHSLYVQSPQKSQERQQAIEMLLAQAHWSGITVAQAQEAVLALCYASAYRSKERKQAIQALIEVIRRPGLSFEDAVVLDDESHHRQYQSITPTTMGSEKADVGDHRATHRSDLRTARAGPHGS